MSGLTFPVTPSGLAGARLLLVEDNAINQELACNLLGRAGILVTVVGDGRQALEMLDREAFDGVLMDCQMPVMDGYEATRRLRRQERLARMPVIAMTADAAVGDRDKAIAAGMNDHVGKPLNIDDLFATLARWIRPAGCQEDQQAAGAAVDSLDRLPGIDVATWQASGIGDDALYRRLLKMFLEQQHDFPARFLAASAAGDFEAACRLAHTLRSVAGTLGAHGVERAAEVLEDAGHGGMDPTGLQALVDEVARQLAPVMQGLRALSG